MVLRIYNQALVSNSCFLKLGPCGFLFVFCLFSEKFETQGVVSI